MTKENESAIKALEIDYRTGRVGRGAFKRRVMRLGWTARDVQGFEREHKTRRKQIMKRAGQR